MTFNLKRFFIGIILVTIYLWLSYFGVRFDSAIEASNNIVSSIRSYGDLAFFSSLAVAIIHQFIPFPGHLLSMANSIVFGPFLGFLITMLGWFISSQLGFGLAKFLGRPIEKHFLKKNTIEKVDSAVNKQGPWMILTLRFMPPLSFSLLNFAFGLTNISWKRFTWTTMVGVLPSTTFSTAVGAGLISITNSQADYIIVLLVLISSLLWSIQAKKTLKK